MGAFTPTKGNFYKGKRYRQLVADEDSYNYGTGEYECSICDRGFQSLRSLNQHLSSGTHDGNNYKCSSCGKSFARATPLFQHQQNSDACNDNSRLGRVLMKDYSQSGQLLLTNGIVQSRKPEIVVKFDGSAQPNPGKGGAGYVLIDVTNGSEICGKTVRIEGDSVTSNIAEYIGLIHGLKAALKRKARRIKVRGDSQLVLNQMDGSWKCRNDLLKLLRQEAQGYVNKFSSVIMEHVPRERNKKADQLANLYTRYDMWDETYDGDIEYNLRRSNRFDSSSDDYW